MHAVPEAEVVFRVADVDLAPYSVMFLEIERNAGVGGCTNPAPVGAARLTLSKLLAPSGDDQLKLAGTVAVATSPSIDLVANGMRLTLATGDGLVLADLTATAGSGWKVNGASTAWKYRNPSAFGGIVSATVKAIKPAGTLKVKLKARGLGLGGAAASPSPVATIAFGAPSAAPDNAASRRSRPAGRRRTGRRCAAREGRRRTAARRSPAWIAVPSTIHGRLRTADAYAGRIFLS
jgi:hypothetical protein